jgi:predicted ATPase/DNA-binding SARP family transcriptional activator
MAAFQGLYIQLLGGFKVSVAARTVDHTAWKRESARKLVALLALSSDQKLSKDRMSNLLGFGTDSRKLANALYSARQALGESATYVRSDRSSLWLDLSPEVRVDVNSFEQMINLGEMTDDVDQRSQFYASAVALYSGKLLPEYDDSMILSYREALQMRYSEALKVYGALLESESNHEAALFAFERRFLLDVSDADAASKFVALLASSDKVQAALDAYERHRLELATVSGNAPSNELQEIASGLRAKVSARTIYVPQVTNEGIAGPPNSSDKNESRIGLPDVPSTSRAITIEPSLARLARPGKQFLGRQGELTKLVGLLNREDSRLVTLYGIGGVGKTALAAAVAAIWVEDTSVVSRMSFLADVRSIGAYDSLEALLARALRVETEDLLSEDVSRPNGSITSTILVINNFELVRSQRSTLSRIVRVFPGLKLLVTSRLPLGLPQEQAFHVSPLAVDFPSIGGFTKVKPSIRELRSEYPAMELFCSCVEKASSTVSFQAFDVDALINIVRALAGVPLAIEIAATRCRYMSVQNLWKSLEVDLITLDRKREFPVSDARYGESMLAILEWTYNELSEQSQKLLRLLSVFVDGFKPLTVSSASDGYVNNVFLCLDELIDHNLIVVAAAHEQITTIEYRCKILEPVRRFAFSLLSQSENDITDAYTRHAASFARELSQMAASVQEKPQMVARQYSADEANIDLALGTLAQHDRSNFVRATANVSRLVGPVMPSAAFVGHFHAAAAQICDITESTDALLLHQATLLSWFFFQPQRPGTSQEVASVLSTCAEVECLYFSLKGEQLLSNVYLGCLFRAIQGRYFVQNCSKELLQSTLEIAARLPQGVDRFRNGQRIRASCNSINYDMTLRLPEFPSIPRALARDSVLARRQIELQLTDCLVRGENPRSSLALMAEIRDNPDDSVACGENIIELLLFSIEAQVFEHWDVLVLELAKLLGDQVLESSQRVNASQARLCSLGCDSSKAQVLNSLVGDPTVEDWLSVSNREEFVTHCVRFAIDQFSGDETIKMLTVIDEKLLGVLSVHFASRLTEAFGAYCVRKKWLDLAERFLALANSVREVFDMKLTLVEVVVRSTSAPVYASMSINDLTNAGLAVGPDECYGEIFGAKCRPILHDLIQRVSHALRQDLAAPGK